MATLLIEPVAKLIEAFNRLPGIGPKTAQRLTYHLLRAPDVEARALASALVAVRCVATNIDLLPDLPTDDEAAWILAEARRIFGEEGADPAEVG